MKNILGLDLGTNSIGWALIQTDENGRYQREIRLGSRIIPMTQDVLGKFESGAPTESQTANRTQKRGMRRLYERRALRRERLLRVLHVLGFLPAHFDQAIGWDRQNTKTFGKFKDVCAEPKLAWCPDEHGRMSFLFKNSFDEMLADFAKHQPALVADGKRIPYDWTLYYLRQKALTQPISKEELAWILLNFNQKRGYYQLRGKDELQEPEEDNSKRVEYIECQVVAVDADSDDKPSAKGIWYNVHLDNGMVYRRQSQVSLEDWVGKSREFIVTTELNEDGSEKLDKEGHVKRSFRAPKAEDWTLRKVRSEQSLAQSGLTVGAYIYQQLLCDPSCKIIGSFVQTIDRHFYKEELYAIVRRQMDYHSELTDVTRLQACVAELYARNEAKQQNLVLNDMAHLLIEDVLFYQRPLKSKKSLISECPYEAHSYADKSTGEIKSVHVKCIAKSNPYFQEFRMLQFLQYLKVYDATGMELKDVTQQYLPDADAWQRLYAWMMDRAEVSEESFLKDFLGIKKPKGKDSVYPLQWNYVRDKKYPAGETRSLLLKGLKTAGVDTALLSDAAIEYRLWHLLYSIDDVAELKGALVKFADAYDINDGQAFVDAMSRLKPFEKEYGSYSEKAIKKILPGLREGKKLRDICLELYGRYSEGLESAQWTSPDDLHAYILNFKQYSLRNPIVEQCILETLRTVEAIWRECGHIDEIHLELGREMKNPADKRKRISEQNQRNENTNLRIKALLQELLNDSSVEDVRPNSPMQQDILRIYEEGALQELKSTDPDYKEILAISQMSQPSASQVARYKLWLEQRYRSPYTGRTIPLAKLFTPAYQIEHVVPKARYYDDSMNNKVICEAEVNKLKTNLLAHEFIAQHGGEVVQTMSGPVKVFNQDEYETFVKEHYAQAKGKMQHLLWDDVPEEFIQRQMNDSRYISKVVKSLLSNVVREAEGDDQDMSKNVVVCTGSVTDKLKKDWGMNDVWNHLMYPRYERLNQLTGTQLFGHWDNKQGKRVFQTTMPLALQRGYSKKRIDHRHHAMDALVIACATRNIVNLLSNQNAHDGQSREDLKHKLVHGGLFLKPWDTFTQDAEKALAGVVISFKNNVRVLNRATNRYEHYNADGHKEIIAQTGEHMMAVRKPLHKETVFGQVNLRRKKMASLDAALSDVKNIADRTLRTHIIDLFSQGLDKKKIKKQLQDEGIGKQIEIYFYSNDAEPMVAVRKALDESFDQKRILSITDTGIQKILLAYLEARGNDPKVAFSPEGIVDLNNHIADYNDGHKHQPIHNVRVAEPMGEKYNVGYTGSKGKKFVEAQGGTNLYFAIYEGAEGKRSYATVPLNVVVERLKQGLTPAPEKNEAGDMLKFTLSPNDLVYVPTEDECQAASVSIAALDGARIYKFVSATKSSGYFVPHRIATPLLALKKETDLDMPNTVVHEISLGNGLGKIEREPDQPTIKSVCWKLEVNRLGQITKIIR